MLDPYEVTQNDLRDKGFTLIELMIVVSILGILAAVAVPAFVNYINRAKTTEATLNVQRMFSGAVTYFDSEHSAKTVTLSNSRHALPASKEWTPAQGTCSGRKCDVGTFIESFQANNVWQSLDFSMADNFYYSYQFASCVDTGGTCPAQSTVYCQASGDLDGDSTYSYFERAGEVASNSQGWAMQGSAGIYRFQPLE